MRRPSGATRAADPAHPDLAHVQDAVDGAQRGLGGVDQRRVDGVDQTAVGLGGGVFEYLGVRPGQRWDRPRPRWAANTADLVQLVRIFAISKTTAIKYVAIAQPERFIDPTQP